LSLSYNITVLDDWDDGTLLNGGWTLETVGVDTTEKLWLQIHGIEVVNGLIVVGVDLLTLDILESLISHVGQRSLYKANVSKKWFIPSITSPLLLLMFRLASGLRHFSFFFFHLIFSFHAICFRIAARRSCSCFFSLSLLFSSPPFWLSFRWFSADPLSSP